MQIQEWLRLFLNQIYQTQPLEWIAVAFSVASVLFSRVNSVWLYPTGIASTALFTYLFIHPATGLYAEGFLNLYYFIMSVYGWSHWLNGNRGKQLSITKTNRSEWLITIAIVLFGWILLYLVLSNFTDSTVPKIDAWVAATAWAGMWLLARRKIENWILLNISNLCAVPLLFYKKMPLTALLTVFLFVVAIFGYFNWKKIYSQQLKSESN